MVLHGGKMFEGREDMGGKFHNHILIFIREQHHIMQILSKKTV